jgi:hypothetical protein
MEELTHTYYIIEAKTYDNGNAWCQLNLGARRIQVSGTSLEEALRDVFDISMKERFSPILSPESA